MPATESIAICRFSKAIIGFLRGSEVSKPGLINVRDVDIDSPTCCSGVTVGDCGGVKTDEASTVSRITDGSHRRAQIGPEALGLVLRFFAC